MRECNYIVLTSLFKVQMLMLVYIPYFFLVHENKIRNHAEQTLPFKKGDIGLIFIYVVDI